MVVFDIVFAAFFSAKEAASSQASGIVPGIQLSSRNQTLKARMLE
jgi:hypothetical protein